MQAKLALDKNYISMMYPQQVAEVAKSAPPSYLGDSAEQFRLNKEKASLVLDSCAKIILQAVSESVTKDINCTTAKLSFGCDTCSYTSVEDTLRKIFADFINVKIEESELYKQKIRSPENHEHRRGYHGYNTEIYNSDVTVLWKSQQAKELRILFGLSPVPAPDLEKKKRQNEFRTAGTYCDYTFLVQDKKFPVHKIVLAEHTDFFDRMFSGSFKEGHTVEPVKFGSDDLSPEVFEAFLTYIYTGDIDVSLKDAKFIIQLADLGNQSLLKDLVSLCNACLRQSITKATFYDIALFATEINDAPLIAMCKCYLAENKSLIDAIDLSAMTSGELIGCYGISTVLQCEELKKICIGFLNSKLDKDHFQEICEAVNGSPVHELKEELRRTAFEFATKNEELLNSDSLKPARKAYTQLMTGLERPAKKQKTENRAS